MKNKAIISGMGMVSPFGLGKDAFLRGLTIGDRCIKAVTGFQTSDKEMFGGEIKNFGAMVFYGKSGAEFLHRTVKMALIAGQLALLDYQFRTLSQSIPNYTFAAPNLSSIKLISILPSYKKGIVIGSSVGAFNAISEFDKDILRSSLGGFHSLKFPNIIMNAMAAHFAIQEAAKGVNLTVSSGAASSLDALSLARDCLRVGQEEIIISGGVFELSPCSYLMYRKMGLLCKSLDDYNPLEGKKSGTFLGEGGVFFVIERPKEEKNAVRIAEIEGYGSAFDAKSPQNQYDPKAGAAIEAIEGALNDAGVTLDDIDFVSSGLSGIEAGDDMELSAIRQVFKRDVPLIAIKSLVGETYDASGAFQIAAAIYVFENNVFPKNCSLNSHALDTNKKSLRALITSFDWSGHNSAMVIKK